MNASEFAPRDPLSVTPKDYLKNYLEMVTPFVRGHPSAPRPIKALGGAYMTPRGISGVVKYGR